MSHDPENAEKNPVTREDDYRRFAAQTMELASRTSDLKDKRHLLAMTEAWLNLADRIARLVKQPKASIGEHPAVSARLGREQREAG
jgi:hypothetical protein